MVAGFESFFASYASLDIGLWHLVLFGKRVG
jgi:hypothetical protein